MKTSKNNPADSWALKPYWKYLGAACLFCTTVASIFVLVFLAQVARSVKMNVPLAPGLQHTLLFLAVSLFIVGALGISLFLWLSVVRNYFLIRRNVNDTTSYAAAIVESSEDAVIGNTLTGIITSWNKGAERMYGYTADEMIGCPIQLLVPIHLLAQVQIVLRKLTTGESVKPFETKRIRKDGIVIDVSVTVSPVLDAHGKVVGTSMIARDITQKKIIEQQQEAQSKAIEHTNQQLARREKIMRSLLEDLHESKKQLEIQKKSLERANERLESLNKIKDDFVATASHELRTPLTAIREGISLIHDRVLGPINEEQCEFLNVIDESIDRLSELVNTILDLSKIEAGRFRLARRRVSVSDIIRSVVENYKTKNGKRNIRLEIHEVPDIFADPHRITQVVWNFFSNALKFTEENGLITFSVQEDGGVVKVCVEDNGVGISKDDMTKLFKKFSQVGEQFPRGTGLGLALCKEIVELHDGNVFVNSKQGMGSRFTFTIPVYSFDLAAQKYFSEQQEAAKSLDRQTVLLIALDPASIVSQLSPERETASEKFFQEAVEVVRKNMYSADAALPLQDKIYILAAAEESAVSTITKRMRLAFANWLGVSTKNTDGVQKYYGAAVFPDDGQEVSGLIAIATQRLAEGKEERASHA